jgi:hypothetical protein
MSLEKNLKCDLCDKLFETRAGMWKHKKTKHTEEIIKIDNNICKYCNKSFSSRSSRWRHETTICKIKQENENNTNINTINSNNINNSTIQKLANNNSTFNDNSNNIQNQTINITINQLGCEDISLLTQDETEEIINNGLDCVIKLIEFINFNKEHPQNHSFCTTSLNNKYTSVLNPETNEIEKKLKIDVFDKVLFYALTHIDMLKDNIIDKHKKEELDSKIQELNAKLFGKDIYYKKNFINQLNLLSYNNRKMISKTWDEYFGKLLVSNL